CVAPVLAVLKEDEDEFSGLLFGPALFDGDRAKAGEGGDRGRGLFQGVEDFALRVHVRVPFLGW
ncbi:hypothetical protein ABE10_00325, partial [Bacillus toyonensis]|nr:hypothetical protein [Bacillus toyonensis]